MWAPKTPRLAAGPLAEQLIERLGLLRPCGGDEAGPVALACVAIEGELADAEDLALAEGLVHVPVGVGEDPQGAHLAGQPLGRRASSSWVIPSRTSRPGPISATVSPATATEARLTR